MGTAAYMSPEQVRGKELDTRSDLFSFGLVLYEMSTGLSAFTGKTSGVLFEAILNKMPPSPVRINPSIPPHLEEVIRKCLEKDRELRCHSAAELRTDLKRIRRELQSAPSASVAAVPADAARPWWRARLVLISAALLLAVTLAGGSYLLMRDTQAIDSVAVLPFSNSANDPQAEYLSDGITESLINSLSQSPNLKVMSRSAVFHYKGQVPDLKTVGSDLGVRAVLTGRLVQRGDNLSISVELVDARNSRSLWGEQYNRKLSDLLTVQDELAKDIYEKLRAHLSGEEAKRITKRYTENAEAYQIYLKGLYFWNRWTEDGFKKAIEQYQTAVQRDPSYALAYTGLADSYILLGDLGYIPAKEAWPKARDAAASALAKDASLAEGHISTALVKELYDWDWKGAEQEFQRAIELNPKSAAAYHWYGEFLAKMGRFDEAAQKLQRAEQLDTLSPMINATLGWLYFVTHQYERATDQLKKTLDMDPNFAPARRTLEVVYAQRGMHREALAEWQKALTLSGNPELAASLEHDFVASGYQGLLRDWNEGLKAIALESFVSPYGIAQSHARLGEKGPALEWLARAYNERDSRLVALKVDPCFDALRSDPVFQNLLRRVGLP